MLDGSLKLEVSFLNASLVRFSLLFTPFISTFVRTKEFLILTNFVVYHQIPDIFPLLAAAQKALISKSRDSLSTRTLHSELVYNYSGSKHVSTIFSCPS